MAIETIFLALVAAMLYAGTQFIKKVPTDKPEEFNWTKFLATVVLGGAIGVAAALKGVVPDQTSVELQLALFAGATAVIENGIKIAWRLANKYLMIERLK